MKKWDATMPKARADNGMAHVVLAYKGSLGGRAEFTGQLNEADARALMAQATEMMKRAREEQKQ